MEACEAVAQKKEDSELLQFKVYPEVKEAACLFHQGGYENLPYSFSKIINYIEENGYEIIGSIRESYIDGAWNQDSEEKWLTEIQIPVQKCK